MSIEFFKGWLKNVKVWSVRFWIVIEDLIFFQTLDSIVNFWIRGEIFNIYFEDA